MIATSTGWACYLLECADGTLYCGITNDLEKRLAAHNAGTASKYTRARGPVRLVFVEGCADRSAASKRESEIKSLARSEKLKLCARNASNAGGVIGSADILPACCGRDARVPG